MGPTASGKTAAVLELATRLPVEIISVDSAQVYRDMDIGTAKPDHATLKKFPHLLIDLISPEESYSAARFCEDALIQMAEITARGHIPLLVGGTMLYFKALREGLSDMPAADAEIRREIDAQALVRGWPALHAELAKLDAETAARLKPNDAQRIQRALEIIRLTGEPLATSFARKTTATPPYRFIPLGLMPSERSVLHERIAQRFESMLKLGLIDEVEGLRRQYNLHANLPSMRSVGYRQAWDYLEGCIDLATLKENSIAATRQLAKRQMTWLRGMSDVPQVDCLAPDLATHVLGMIESQLDSSI